MPWHTLGSQGGILVQPTQNELDPPGCSTDLAGGMASRIHPNGKDFPPVRSSELMKNTKKGLKWSKMACLSPFLDQLSQMAAIFGSRGPQACHGHHNEAKKSTIDQVRFEAF